MKKRKQASAARVSGVILERPVKPPTKPESSAACPPDAGEAVAQATEVGKRRVRVILGYDRTP